MKFFEKIRELPGINPSSTKQLIEISDLDFRYLWVFEVREENTSIAAYTNTEIDYQPNSRHDKKGCIHLRIFSSLPNGIGAPLLLVLFRQIHLTPVTLVKGSLDMLCQERPTQPKFCS